MTNSEMFQSLPIAVISQAQQQDRYLQRTELQTLTDFFKTAALRLEIAETLTKNADEIVATGASRIFAGGATMQYLEKPKEQVGMPGSGYYVGDDFLASARRHGALIVKDRLKLTVSQVYNPVGEWWDKLTSMFSDREPLPGGFRVINVSRYGPVRMKRSMRDLGWFLRYVSYAIVADDASILAANARGLRGVIPEDVTQATVVAIKDMRWQSLRYFSGNADASEIIKHYFDVLIAEYLVEKPTVKVRIGVDNEQQGLVLPQSYDLAAQPRPKFVMKSVLPHTEKQAVIKAAYRQVFERDITATFGFNGQELESQVSGGQISMKEFIRCLGKSRLYRRLYYEPFNISRVVELAMRHFLGRGLSSQAEFREYFAIITKGGLAKLVDALVNSAEYDDYFGEETVPYLRGLGVEAQECRNWEPQMDLLKYNAAVRKVPQFVTRFGKYEHPLPNQHPYGMGNDPLEIQFGAIFPTQLQQDGCAVTFSPDNRRILINTQNGLGKAISKHVPWNAYTEKTIHAAYKQVFGCDVLAGQRLTVAEAKLIGGEITMREFVRQLAKSRWFRRLYWESLYVTKAIEYIHRRLLGRPTYGRLELNRYYDICARQGFYALIDALVDGAEYRQVFGEDRVPYERLVTPRGYALRSASSSVLGRMVERSHSSLDAFVPNHRNYKPPVLEGSAHVSEPVTDCVLEPEPVAEVMDGAVF